MQKIKKGDTVEVITGKDKGKRGKVLELYASEGKLKIEGVAVQKRHLKAGANQKIPNGGIIDKPAKVDISNVKFYSEKLGKAVRVGIEVREDGSKVRVARGRHGERTPLD